MHVAGEVMDLLDKHEDYDAHALVKQAGKNVGATQLSPYMAGFVREVVLNCHSRGREFSERWDIDRVIYLVRPPSLPEAEEKRREAELAYRLLKEDYQSLEKKSLRALQRLEEKCAQLRIEIFNLRKENTLLKNLVPLDFPEHSHESARRTPRILQGMRAPWELEYEAANL
jgi:hypothetical protein